MTHTPAPAQEPAFEACLRPGVHPLDRPDRVLAVYDEVGHGREVGRTCPHGAHDLALVGLVNVTTRELMCGVTGERWSLDSLAR